MSHHVEGAERQDPKYGSLTNSLIFPKPLQFLPMPQQGWQAPMGWQQDDGSVGNGFTNIYQGQMMGAGANYLYNEQDFLPYDGGEDDLYDNQQQQQWDPHGEAEAQPRNDSSDGIPRPRAEPGALTIQRVSQSLTKRDQPNILTENQKPVENATNSKMNTAPSDRAAELRAKLLAIRSASGTTPVPELNTNKDVRLNEADTTGVASHGRFKADMKAEPNPSSKEAILTRKSDLVQKGTPEKLLDRRNSETDIEGLFAEARAAVEAEKTPASEHLRKVHGVGKRNTLPSKKVRESSPGAERRSSLNDSVDSFGTSEQGEIHDNHVHLGKARPLKQVEISRKSDGPAKEVEIERQRQPVVVTGNSMRQQKYVDTDLANSHGDRPSPDSARVRPGSTSSRTASADHQTQPKASMQRSKEDHLTHAERSYRPDREIYVSPQDSERERERKAAEYKRELESRRQRSGDARITADRDVEDSRRPRQTNPSTPKDPDARLHAKETQVARAHPMEDIEDLEDWLQMTGYYDRSYRQKALDRNRKLMALDAQRAELEREAQLEYEERAQIARAQSVLPQESIEGDIARVGISPRSLRTSSVITMPPPPVPIKRSSDNVGLRIKDLATRENVASGRRLEEDLHTSTQIETMSPIERSTLKRHHNPEDREPEGLRPVAKIARMDMNGRLTSHVDVRPSSLPVRASPVSLDERITKDNNSWTRDHHRDFAHGEVDVDRHSRVTRGRPGSPYRDMNRQRLRSLSPIPRRTNGYDTYATGRRMSDEIMTDRSGRSPRQPIVSREPSPVRRAYDSRDAYQSLAYTELRDNHPPRNVYEKNLKPEPVSHALSEYQDYIPSRSAYEHHQYTSTGGRGRGRGRGGYFSTRGGYKSYRGGEEQCSDNAGSQALDLRAGDSRYFLIKSWNYENVDAAQREGIWVTQEKNLETLIEAYKTCRNVILAFSVNKSVAFQGYARMQSLPGAVKTPAWARELHWATSPPFKIRWITIAETRSSRVHHIKNALNENQGVHVGRDGQEIEEQCGVALCETIDAEFTKMQSTEYKQPPNY